MKRSPDIDPTPFRRDIGPTPFHQAHRSLINRLEREGISEETKALRAQVETLAAALREIVRRDEAHDGRHQYAGIARAALAKVQS